MHTLHSLVKRKEKANTRVAAIRKAPAKKKVARKYSPSPFVTKSWGSREDALDVRLIREARKADRGKPRFSVNELRAKRDLAAI
jgi:hypothetical protein